MRSAASRIVSGTEWSDKRKKKKNSNLIIVAIISVFRSLAKKENINFAYEMLAGGRTFHP